MCMHVGTERTSEGLIAKILLQVISTIQVKVNLNKSLTRWVCLGFFVPDHYIRNPMLLLSSVDLSSGSKLTIFCQYDKTCQFQGIVPFRSGMSLSKSCICILYGACTNKILKQITKLIQSGNLNIHFINSSFCIEWN